MWKLSKLKKGILEISSIKVEFEDTFSSVHLRDYYIDKYRLKPPCKVDKVLMPTTYQSLLDLITEINLFKPREEVPNRMVQTDIPGRSKLIRSHDKGTITLCYRKPGGKPCTGGGAKSSNTCYISEEDSFHCYENFYQTSGFKGNPVYYITPGHPEFKYWSNFMDQEYARLAGIKYHKIEKPKITFEKNDEWKGLYESCLCAYAETKRGTDLIILEEIAQAGYCRLNDRKTALYDKNGYWVCSLEELLEKDGEAYMLKSIMNWLGESSLLKVKWILCKYIEQPNLW